MRIFATVGTHEQQFDRLVTAVNALCTNDREIFIQTGFSTVIPDKAEWKDFLSYQEMDWQLKQADIVITHGGPSSFIEAIRASHVPIVVPRQKQYGEHVNDHQVEFVRFVSERIGIIPVYDINDLARIIDGFGAIEANHKKALGNHTEQFAQKLEEIVFQLKPGEKV